jgi:hypothetical protein
MSNSKEKHASDRQEETYMDRHDDVYIQMTSGQCGQFGQSYNHSE